MRTLSGKVVIIANNWISLWAWRETGTFGTSFLDTPKKIDSERKRCAQKGSETCLVRQQTHLSMGESEGGGMCCESGREILSREPPRL
jgi:hypothetical protein